MGRPLYTNNAATYLAFGITNTATTMQVSANTGHLFPSPVGGDYFYVSLISLSGPIIEIVKCTARNGDVFTIERGQEGTTPLYWNMGDNVQLRITAAGMNFITGATATTTEEESQVATQGQTVFTLTTFDYAPGTNNLSVFVNGSKQVAGLNYSETAINTVTFLTGLNAGDIVEFILGLTIASGTLYATDIRYNEGQVNAVTYTVEKRLQQFVTVKDFGAVGDGVTDDTTAINNAISAVQSLGSSNGGTLYFPSGTYLINSTIMLPNRVGLQGENGRSVVIKPTSSFSSAYMFYAVNGTSSMFGSWIKDMYIDSRGKNMTAVVRSDAWQETCGMERVVIQFDGTTNAGFLYQNGYGGAAYLRLIDVEIFSDSTYATAKGINIGTISSVGMFVLHFDSGTIAGSVAHPLPIGIYMANDTLVVNTYHGEYVANMVVMNGAGGISADTVTGSFNNVTNIISLGSTFTGVCNLRNIMPNGATGNVLQNDVSGRNISQSEGVLAEYVYQPSSFSAVVNSQINNITGNGTAYTIIFNSKEYDYLGEYNTTNGYFTAQKTGKYLISAQVGMAVTTGVTTCTLEIDTSTKQYYMFVGDTDNIYSGSGTVFLNGSCIVDLNAGQTAKVVLTISGLGSDTVDILASKTRFSGQWLSR
jgi:hypothetical protein